MIKTIHNYFTMEFQYAKIHHVADMCHIDWDDDDRSIMNVKNTADMMKQKLTIL